MNKNIVLPVLIALLLPVFIFFYTEKVGINFIETVPSTFLSQFQKIFKTNETNTPTETAQALEFLNTLPAVTDNPETVTGNQENNVDVYYKVVYTSEWSEGTHSGYFPENAHMSPIVVWSHASQREMFRLDEKASPGIEKMAELGGTITLEEELSGQRNNGVYDYKTGKRIDSPGESEVVVSVNPRHPFLTAVSALAPSPDWFIAMQDISLIDVDGEFITEIIVPVVVLDAGTENGLDFSSKNEETNPREDIANLTDIPANTLPRFGYFTITQVIKN